ncbi:MAG: twin-arginine translocation signal domain-containing protein, partial [Pseudomonadales bacterium]|nr:twin-arginine translocation signal domain-containing protein [Pseudomonadales bacterium]
MHDNTNEKWLLSRRQLLKGASLALGAGVLAPASLNAQTRSNGGADAVVFTHTTVVTNDAERRTLLDVALAVQNGVIAAIGDTNEVLAQFPNAQIYDGSRKALLPGLINCHAHLSASLERGFNEDLGFPNSLQLPLSPGRL